MSDISKYEAQKKKLEGLCEEHKFTFSLKKEVWPITLTISPLQGMDNQMSMLEEADGTDYISPDASLTWIFDDGDVTSRVEGGTFTMPKTLESKFVNIFRKMVAFWQMYFFRYLVQNGFVTRGRHMPVIDESDEGVDDEPDEDDEDDEDSQIPEDPDIDHALVSLDGKLIADATDLVRQENKATISLLQRRLKIGYSKAASVMQALEDAGVVGPYRGSEFREVLPADLPDEA